MYHISRPGKMDLTTAIQECGSFTQNEKPYATVVPLDEAVGKLLAHDITEIRPSVFKGAAFKKGHIITEEDLPHLKRLGKEHLYVLHMRPGEVHEDDAAILLGKALAGLGVTADLTPSEGKVSLRAEHNGLLKVHAEALIELNMVPDICCSSRHNNSFVEKGTIIAATRVIPLVIREELLNAAIRVVKTAGGIFSVKELSTPEVGLIVTGNEVFKGLIEDRFEPVIKKKMECFGCKLKRTRFAPDDKAQIAGFIKELVAEGAELIIVAGGMSVDPDDVSRAAVAEAGATDLVYGTPILPGAMFLYGRIGEIPVVGLPACVLYYRATVLDLVLPRILAGEAITRRSLAEMAHGGLCLSCKECHYPVCPFGK